MQPIILTGPPASGKTWTANAIAGLFDKVLTLSQPYSIPSFKRRELRYFELIIIDECGDSDEITMIQDAIKGNPTYESQRLVFLTQKTISPYLPGFKVIRTNFKAGLYLDEMLAEKVTGF